MIVRTRPVVWQLSLVLLAACVWLFVSRPPAGGPPAAEAVAQPMGEPSRFSGIASLNNAPAPAGTAVTANLGPTVCGQTTAGGSGAYTIEVASAITQPGCGTDGAIVSFFVGGARSGQIALFRGGVSRVLDLFAVQMPSPSPSRSPSPSPAASPSPSAAPLPAISRINGPDADFGNGGLVTTDFGGSDEAHGLAIQPDGKIVVAGTTNAGGDRFVFALARYNADGSLDTGFGDGGKVTTPVGEGDAIANAVAVEPTGGIVVAGYASVGRDFNIAVARYGENGRPDTSFGFRGVLITGTRTGSTFGRSLLVQPDGTVVVIGTTGSDELVILRADLIWPVMRPDGFAPTDSVLDVHPRGEDGIKVDGVSGNTLWVLMGDLRGIVERVMNIPIDNRLDQTNGVDTSIATLLLAGAENGRFAVAFPGSDPVVADFGDGPSAAYALTALRDARIVAVGQARYDFALARFAVSPVRP